ncbi:helix-turn-helix transcriptional regulator [Parabacteroides goldsteinii]|jgi:DNA-binding CsgD family transcriptional regulator|uniref:response regulator transcription factor n=1 Tax=Parabacteroides goldsteinii TaxID=328812 RepID=UPI001CCFA116|nr:helix-turn-helix transcriptional regulator [Parabacteroides goldsteinii]UBD73548.1 helix-turn-helix transcriptional regulator [Parabacteroides goldsteinii]
MNKDAQLTKRERQVAERIAWGASFKEAAYALHIAYKTVDNVKQRIFKKTGCTKINELSAWWFCTHYNISFDLSPAVRSAIASVLLMVFIGGEIHYSKDFCRYRAGRRCRIEYRNRIKD